MLYTWSYRAYTTFWLFCFTVLFAIFVVCIRGVMSWLLKAWSFSISSDKLINAKILMHGDNECKENLFPFHCFVFLFFLTKPNSINWNEFFYNEVGKKMGHLVDNYENSWTITWRQVELKSVSAVRSRRGQWEEESWREKHGDESGWRTEPPRVWGLRSPSQYSANS